MGTLNGGFSLIRNEMISAEDRDLIADFIKRKGVKKIIPGSANGNEADRSTNELVAKRRREFRSQQRKMTKKVK